MKITRHPATTGFLLAVKSCWRSLLERWKRIFQEGIFKTFFNFWKFNLNVGKNLKTGKRTSYNILKLSEYFLAFLSKFFQRVVKITICDCEETYEGNCFSEKLILYQFRKTSRKFLVFWPIFFSRLPKLESICPEVSLRDYNICLKKNSSIFFSSSTLSERKRFFVENKSANFLRPHYT